MKKEIEVKVQLKDDETPVFPTLGADYLAGMPEEIGMIENGPQGPIVLVLTKTQDGKHVITKFEALLFLEIANKITMQLNKFDKSKETIAH